MEQEVGTIKKLFSDSPNHSSINCTNYICITAEWEQNQNQMWDQIIQRQSNFEYNSK